MVASEAEGFRLVRRVVEQWHTGVNRFAGLGEVLLGARLGSRLVGICGLMCDPYLKDPGVGRLRNLYVLPDVRRHGVGGALSKEIIRRATGAFEVLRLRAGTEDAARLYEGLGFRRAKDLPDTTHILVLSSARPTAGSRVAS